MLIIENSKTLLVTIGMVRSDVRFTFSHPEVTLNQQRTCWWLLDWCPPLPIPNREVKPRTADDTWIKPGKVGSRHNTITNRKKPLRNERLFAFVGLLLSTSSSAGSVRKIVSIP